MRPCRRICVLCRKLVARIIDFRTDGDEPLRDLPLDPLQPRFGASGPVLEVPNLGLKLIDPTFGSAKMTARLLQHGNDGVAGLIRWNAVDAPASLRRKFANCFGYVDRTPIGRMRGRVLELATDRRVVFHQATERGDLAVTIVYELEPTAGGTRVVRTGEISTRGPLALVHPVVVWSTRAENRRTMAALRDSLER